MVAAGIQQAQTGAHGADREAQSNRARGVLEAELPVTKVAKRSASPNALLIRKVSFSNGHVEFRFRSGESLTRDLARYPSLNKASWTARRNYRIQGRGMVAHWPSLDEDISAAQLLGVPEEVVARAAAQDLRVVPAEQLIHEGEIKQEIADEISDLAQRRRRRLGPGSKESRAFLVDIADAVHLPVGARQSKPEIAAAIVRRAGLRWTQDCDSTGSPSGGGSTITRVGLQRMRDAVKKLVQRG